MGLAAAGRVISTVRVEDLADLAGQRFQGEGLLQEACGHVNFSVALEGGFGTKRTFMSGRTDDRAAASFAPPIWGITTSVIIKSMVPSYARARGSAAAPFSASRTIVQGEKFAGRLPDCRFVF